MDEKDRIRLAKVLWGGFFRCPNTNLIIPSMRNDDKVLCGCGRSNPKVPREHPGVHVIRFLEIATADEFVKQSDQELLEFLESGGPRTRMKSKAQER